MDIRDAQIERGESELCGYRFVARNKSEYEEREEAVLGWLAGWLVRRAAGLTGCAGWAMCLCTVVCMLNIMEQMWRPLFSNTSKILDRGVNACLSEVK